MALRPLTPEQIAAFRGGKFSPMNLAGPLKLYRAGGMDENGNEFLLGGWWFDQTLMKALVKTMDAIGGDGEEADRVIRFLLRGSLALPNDASLCGRRLVTQAGLFGGGQPFALTNAQDLVLGTTPFSSAFNPMNRQR